VKQQVDINQNINVAVIQAEQLMQLSQRGRNAIDVTPTVLKTVEKIDKSNT
jgi:protein required for attachment to host cells